MSPAAKSAAAGLTYSALTRRRSPVLEYALADGTWHTPGGHPVTFRYREGTNDWNTITSIMAPEDEYGLPRDLSGVAVDVGAYIGGVAVALALDNPRLRVIAIEPVPPNADLTRHNAAANGASVEVFEGAVGDGGLASVWWGYRGSEALEHHAFVGNSTLAYDHGGDMPHEETTYRSLTLASVVWQAGGWIDWLKIDTEGAEWAFLASPAVEKVGTIVGEWHPVRGHEQGHMAELLLPTHRVAFTGPREGPGGFRAVLR